MQVQKVLSALSQIEAALSAGALTEQQINNAMANLDRATSCFGKSARQWRKVGRIENNVEICPPYTAQDLREFVAHKREMFAQHPYIAERA